MPIGGSSLPLVELDKSQVSTKRKQIRLRKHSPRRKASDCSFGKFKEHLGFKAIEFFHAAKKTELTRSFTNRELERLATAFAVEYEDAFVWDPQNFRKTDRDVFSIADFDSSRLAGRVGEALAYLTMVKWDYVYWDRCTTLWQRAARAAKVSHSDQLKVAKYLKGKISPVKIRNAPDFVFEKATRQIALMEAKGGFVHPAHDNPPIKDDLAQALKQLKAWSDVISPSPSKSFGIGSYLREESDNHDDPSLIAFVDPEDEEDANPRAVEFPQDLIRRCNYGAWLRGMGLVTSGTALRDQRRKTPEAVSLPVVRIMNRDFAITTLGWKLSLDYDVFFGLWHEPFSFIERGRSALVMGIELNTLRSVEQAIHNPSGLDLLRLDNQDIGALRAEVDNMNWSIMPDGSCMFLLDRDQMYQGLHDRQIFKL